MFKNMVNHCHIKSMVNHGWKPAQVKAWHDLNSVDWGIKPPKQTNTQTVLYWIDLRLIQCCKLFGFLDHSLYGSAEAVTGSYFSLNAIFSPQLGRHLPWDKLQPFINNFPLMCSVAFKLQTQSKNYIGSVIITLYHAAFTDKIVLHWKKSNNVSPWLQIKKPEPKFS